MNPCFSVLFAGNQSDFSAYRTHSSLDNFANLRPDWDRSANQLEQLVGKQGNDAKHEVEPDFFESTPGIKPLDILLGSWILLYQSAFKGGVG